MVAPMRFCDFYSSEIYSIREEIRTAEISVPLEKKRIFLVFGFGFGFAGAKAIILNPISSDL